MEEFEKKAPEFISKKIKELSQPPMSTSAIDEDSFFDDLNEKPQKTSSKIFASSFIVVAIILFCAVGFYAYQINDQAKTLDQLEVIKAEKHNTKEVPEDPGGMVINDMDKTIYDNFSNQKAKLPKVEKLVPQPEEPMLMKKEDFAEIAEKSKEKLLDIKNEVEREKNDIIQPKPENNLTNSNMSMDGQDNISQTERSIKLIQKETKQNTKNKKIAEKVLNSRSDVNVTKGYFVQLGAFKSDNDAQSTWKNISKKYNNILGNLGYYIERKEIPGKGTFYRLKAGPINNESSARLVCKKLGDAKQGCFMVKGETN